MRISDDKMRRIVSDLGLDSIEKEKIVRDCWHFYTDGKAVDMMFFCDDDFIRGMNRVFKLSLKYDVTILAFTLMDTHIHFILYGGFCECNAFVHEYVRLTSYNISIRYGEHNKLRFVRVSYQEINNDYYLKTAICYVLKNAPEGSLPYMYYDYPWSSASLYFRKKDLWTSPQWMKMVFESLLNLSGVTQKRLLGTGAECGFDVKVLDGMIFPAEYVAVEVVERLFRTHRSFNFFICKTKSDDVEFRNGTVPRLSIPLQELRQNRNELCMELFGQAGTGRLSTGQRVQLARVLKSRFNSSIKQIARVCGLCYSEVEGLF